MKASSANRNLTKPLIIALLILTSALLLTSTNLRRTAADGGSGTSTTPTPATFTDYEVAGNAFVTGYGVGTSCPNTSMNCINTQGEPQIRADPAGNFYGSSENIFCVIGGLCGGTFAWSSTDGGQHFTTLPLPNSVSECDPTTGQCFGRAGYSPAGGDTDLAVAPQKNENGLYNVYVASLASARTGLVNIFVSSSRNGGQSWFINPVTALPIDDREWIAADGVNKVCISYHDVALTNHVFVNCSYDGGLTFAQVGDGFDATHQYFGGFNNLGGNIAIDPRNHVIYDVFASLTADPLKVASDLVCDANADCLHAVWVAVSLDGGRTFTDHLIYENPSQTTTYDHQFPSIAIDKTGVVYAAFTDNRNVYYSFSTNFGNTWSAPKQVNQAPSNTAIFPWITAGTAGAIDIVWYGTSFFQDGVVPDNFPSTATWHVYFAQNLQATSAGSSFTQVQASSVIHLGAVCESGATCTGNRDLLDDFGVAASPTTGLAAIIYTSDQYVNSAAEPANHFGSRPCTPTASNTVDCTHTNIAIQTSGTGVNQKNKNHFEVEQDDFEEMDLSNDGGHAPRFTLSLFNTGDQVITSISVQINGLPLALSWNALLPLAVGQTVTASTTNLPVGLILAIGNIYPVTIITTLADGTTETQTDFTIYTLGAGLGL